MYSGVVRGCVAAALVMAAPGWAQSSPSDYTSATRYDAVGRVTGTIAPDPDGAGALRYLATRTTYDPAGRPLKIETGELSQWQSENVAPEDWGTGASEGGTFTVHNHTVLTYDAMGRKLTEMAVGSDNQPVSLTQYRYDNVGRLECTAVRMNPANYASLPSACFLSPSGSDGPDRITRNEYDAAGQLLQVRVGVRTGVEAADVTYSYTPNGKIEYLIDANGNRTTYEYDGFDRLAAWHFPAKAAVTGFDDTNAASALATAGASAGPNSANPDYESYSYDANGNRTALKKRDGSIIRYEYDALNRMTRKNLPTHEDLHPMFRRDVYYEYDLRGLQTAARFDSATGTGIFSTYDGFGRLTSTQDTTDGRNYTVASEYDANGNRTALVHPDGQRFAYQYDGLDRNGLIRAGSTGAVADLDYDNAGRPLKIVRIDDAIDTRFIYDPAGRLKVHWFSDVNVDSKVAWTFTRNPAGQITSEVRDNDDYAFTEHANVDRAYTANGLNQYTAAGDRDFCYDANGNLTADGQYVYLYDIENRLVHMRGQVNTDCTALDYSTGAWKAAMLYDPLGRVMRVNFGSLEDTQFVYDGDALIAEYDDDTGALLRRYVHGANAAADDPMVWYEGAGIAVTDRRHLYADARGSVVLVADKDGHRIAINAYDEYGIPAESNTGRFQYTGQIWLPRLGMYYYKARMYSPTLGRFMQTDPIGYEDQFNLYAYVANDPINGTDPTGKNGWFVKLVKTGVKNLARLSKDQMVRARKQGKNVRAGSRQQARQVERRAHPKGQQLEHGGHSLKDKNGNPTGETGRPHVQTEGESGHTFWSATAAVLSVVEEGLEIVDELTNPLYATELGDGTIPEDGKWQNLEPQEQPASEETKLEDGEEKT